jgi:hypothetical protein
MNITSDIEKVKKLGDEIGYGHLMGLASALWRKDMLENNYTISGVFVPTIKGFIEKEYQKITNNSIKQYDKILEICYNPPMYVKIESGTTFVINDYGYKKMYHHGAGAWSVDFEIKDGKITIVSDLRTLNGLVLIPCTKEEYEKDNEGHI